MRKRSPTYSPSPRGRYPPRKDPPREPPTSLLVRNLPKNCRAEDLRSPFKRFGPLRDIYLPRDYYTGEPRGFGFVQYLDPFDAEDAQYHMNRKILYGRELTVIFAEENRKKPADMRNKERQRGGGLSVDDGGPYYSYRGCSRTRSRFQTPPQRHRYSRSPSYEDRRSYEFSPSGSPARAPSVDRHLHRSRRQKGGRSGSESMRYGGGRSRSRSAGSPAGRHSQKSIKCGSYSDVSRGVHERSHSPSQSPCRLYGRGRRKSPSCSRSEGSSPARYSRSPSRSPLPPKRGHSSWYSNSRSRSRSQSQSRSRSRSRPPADDRSKGSSGDGGASSECS